MIIHKQINQLSIGECTLWFFVNNSESNWIWNCSFLRTGENRSVWEKPLRARVETKNKLKQNNALAPLQRGSSLGRIGLRRMLSPLCHPCWPSELFRFCQSFSCLLEHIQQYSRSVWVFTMVRRKRAIVNVHTNWARILYRNETISEDLNQKWVNSNSWPIVSNV